MKRKPDAMIAVIILFCLGLVVSGVSAMNVGFDDDVASSRLSPAESISSRY